MRNGIRLEALNFIHVEFDKDRERMASNPPAEFNQEYALPSREAELQHWYRFDYYTRINSIAVSGPAGYAVAHLRGTLAADAIDAGAQGPDIGGSLSHTVLSTQPDLLRWLGRRLTDGNNPVVAAWKARTVVARLVTMAMIHGVEFPNYLKSDVTRKFGEPEDVLDVSNIYSQGVYYDSRKLPSAMDFATWCGFALVAYQDLMVPAWDGVLELKALEYLVARYYGAVGRTDVRSLWDCHA